MNPDLIMAAWVGIGLLTALTLHLSTSRPDDTITGLAAMYFCLAALGLGGAVIVITIVLVDIAQNKA